MTGEQLNPNLATILPSENTPAEQEAAEENKPAHVGAKQSLSDHLSDHDLHGGSILQQVGWTKGMFSAVWSFVGRKIVFVPAILVAIFIAFLVRPWESPPEITSDNLVESWNRSIRKLGIQPVFPPQEDFNVGDILAAIASYEEEIGSPREVAPDKSIVGRSVRIGHINPEAMGYGRFKRPIFSQTILDNGVVKRQPTITATSTTSINNGMDISFVSFPNISITGEAEHGGSISALLGLTSERTAKENEVLSIPLAETYGVSAAEAIAAFYKWCAEPKNDGMCTDAIIRRILAHGVTSKIIEPIDGRFRYQLQILLVTQVYITRELEFRSGSNSSIGSNFGAGDDSQPLNEVAPPDQNPTTTLSESKKPDETNPDGTGARIRQSQAVGYGIDKAIYLRPLVFGFKAVSFALVPSPPMDQN